MKLHAQTNMDILRSKCEDLIAKETDIKEDLSRTEGQRRRPREQIISWLEHVEIIKNQVGVLEKSFEKNNKLCFTNLYHQHKHSKLIVKMTEEVDRLQESSQFFEGLVSSDEPFVEQVPYRPQILAAPTLVGYSSQNTLNEIWEQLMDPMVGIVGIYGKGGVGKTATMMNIHNRLVATKIFDKIIWVSLSKDLSLDKVRNDIAMQLNVYLPTHEDEVSQAARLLESLKKSKKVLIIFDDLWEPVSLKNVGIPLPNEDNGCKIAVTTRFWNVCWRMDTNKNIQVEVLSKQEAWDLFVSKAGYKVLSPDIQPIARQMLRECDCLPILVVSLGHAMRGEVKIKAWEKVLLEFSSSLTMSRDMEEKNPRLLRINHSRLKQFFTVPLIVGSLHRILKKIWENLMDCRVGIVGIWGLGISRNMTMMNIRNMLAATNIFNKIIWVDCSEDMSVDKLWDVIGMQLDVFIRMHEDYRRRTDMNLDKLWDLIGMHEDYRSRTARVLNSLEKVLFVFYDMSKPISFKKLGIPLPNDSNGCKIMVTSDFWEVRRRMETNLDVDFFEEVLSQKESWTSFDSKSFTPDIQRSAWQMVPEQQSPLFGSSIQRTLNEIWDNLMDPKVGIIGVYGKGGVGKTIAMMNTNNRLLETKMFNKIIWVNMSKDMSLEKVQSEIAMQLNMEFEDEASQAACLEKVHSDIAMRLNMEFEDEASQAAYLLRSLKKVKKFLIIFDDMWQPISLMKTGIPLPNEDNGCKIVVTTRFWSVCWQLKTNKNIEVDVLTKTEAWDLFVSTVGEEVLTPDIQPIAREMVRECDLLPVFIISLGHAMRNAIEIEVWDKFLEELTQMKIRNMEERNLILMRLVYSRLKDDAIRNCFLYSAFFPEDYLFESEELIRYWIAENFIKGGGDMVMQINEGFRILDELKDASMFEAFTRKGNEWLKMHDLFRDLAIHIIRGEPNFLVKAGQGLREAPYFFEWGFSRKISLIRNHINTLDDIEYYCPNLSTLLLQDNPLSHISSSFFYMMPAIEVLDMSYSCITELPSSLAELLNLRVLFLQYCKSLKKIPSLENLKKLRVLNLRGASIEELPHRMAGLLSLRSLDLSETTSLKSIQVGLISSLYGLEELQMKGSQLCNMDSPIVADCLKEMRCLEHLAILTLSIVGFEDHLDTIMFLQERNLKRFTISLYGSTGDFI